MDALGIWLLVLVVLPFLMFFLRIILMAWKSILLSKRIKNLSREIEARQSQVPTISGSVDGLSTATSDTPSTSQRTIDEHFKRDLPPTYDEVMKNFLNAKETATSEPQHNASPNVENGTPDIIEIDIEEPPPPQYSNIQS